MPPTNNIADDDVGDESEEYLAYLLAGQSYAESDPTDDGEWTPVPNFPVEIGIDDVDTYLLRVARHEVATVTRNLMQRAFGNYQGSRKNPANVEPTMVLRQFLNPEFMSLIRSQINKHIVGDPFSTDEMMAFVRVQLYLSFYRCSPTAVNKHGVETNLHLCSAMNKIIAQRQRPLPLGRFLLPSLVALWNRIKGGIDVFSRNLKNVKSQHQSMNPYAASWIRLLMAMVYNAHQMHQNLQTMNYLMDNDKCLTFKSFTTRKAKSGSFRSFCRKAAISVDLDSAADDDESDSSNDQNNDGDVEAIGATASGVRRKYNKRNAYFQDPVKIKLRLNSTLCHEKQLLNGNRLTCVYCCCKKHDNETGNHSRLGHKTSYVCFTCHVPLCYVARFGDKSCSQLFHELKAANDPCIDGNEVTVRSHANRAPPPSRKRQAHEQPNTRSKSATIASPRRVRQRKDKDTRRLSFS